MTSHILNEVETRAELIDPALADAGWGKLDHSRVRREVITQGRLVGFGKRGKQDIADYVASRIHVKNYSMGLKKRAMEKSS